MPQALGKDLFFIKEKKKEGSSSFVGESGVCISGILFAKKKKGKGSPCGL